MLSAAGVEFEAVPTDVDELREAGSPEELVVENARQKALRGLELAGTGKGVVSLGVDTEVFLEGRALGKAASEREARERLLALSGRTHEVLSGVVLADASPPPLSTAVARTSVTFRALDEPTLNAYVASGEWRDRAGAYAIQGLGSALVERVEGDFSNVVGLPLQSVLQLLGADHPPDFQRVRGVGGKA